MKKRKEKKDTATISYEESFERRSQKFPGLREGVARELKKIEEREQRKKQRRQASTKS